MRKIKRQQSIHFSQEYGDKHQKKPLMKLKWLSRMRCSSQGTDTTSFLVSNSYWLKLIYYTDKNSIML